jgi:diguanylate cyclase (GGDEF)-like protein
MGKFLAFWGYDKFLSKDLKATYLVSTLAAGIMLVYSLAYLILLDNKGVGISTGLATLALFVVLFLLKKQNYFSGKILLVVILLIQTLAVSSFWFDKESGMNYFFFTFTPASFILFNFRVRFERAIIIATNILVVSFLIISELVTLTPLISLEPGLLNIMRVFSITITMGVIVYVYNFFFDDLTLLHEHLKKNAYTDPLTDVGNRRQLLEIGNKMIKKAGQGSFALMIFDIDFFKKVNDTYGHPVGDLVLKELADLILKNIRSKDLLTRIGGEEFAVVLEDVDDIKARKVAENLRGLVEEHIFEFGSGALQITVSIGLDCLSEDTQDIDWMIDRADKALYQAKENGRNQVKVYEAD